MYPYLHLWGVQLSMTWVGIILAGLVFIVTVYLMSKKYRQDFMKAFNRFPRFIILMYVLGVYVNFVLETGNFIPRWLGFLSPVGYHFSLIGVLWGGGISVFLLLIQFRRNDTKRIWIDILFSAFSNALTVLGLFLLLGDHFVGIPYQGALGVTALVSESALTKYGSVFPVWLIVSLWSLAINVFITFLKIFTKKSGLGFLWFALIGLLFVLILPFWNYSAHGVVSLFAGFSLDFNYFFLFWFIVASLYGVRKVRKPY